MSTILDYPALATPASTAQVYVVYDNKDYRMTLATLLSLVSKASLGLDKVDNTPDLEKPISKAVLAAFGEKANADSVPTLTAFEALSDSLKNYVTLEVLNKAIADITAAIGTYTTAEMVQKAIAEAITPVTDAIGKINDALTAYDQRLKALEAAPSGGVTPTDLEKSLSDLKAELEQTIAANTQSTDTALGLLQNRIGLIEQTLTNLASAIDAKADKAHSHAPGDITDLEAFVTNLVGAVTGNVVFNPSEW